MIHIWSDQLVTGQFSKSHLQLKGYEAVRYTVPGCSDRPETLGYRHTSQSSGEDGTLEILIKNEPKIAEKEKLVDALANQVPLLERLLLIHEHQISSELMPFHKSLEKSFQTMKKHFHQKYNRKDSFFNETTQIRLVFDQKYTENILKIG